MILHIDCPICDELISITIIDGQIESVQKGEVSGHTQAEITELLQSHSIELA